MKLQRHFILLFLAFLLTVGFTGPRNEAMAEEKRSDKAEKKGHILFDFPNAPEPKVEVNLTDKLINLVTKSLSATPEVAELLQMLNGIYVRTYDRITVDEVELVKYYQDKLLQDKWEVLVKIKEETEIVEINLLFDEDVAYGIFVIVMSPKPAEVTFVNIVGEIAPERISELLGNLSNFGMDDIDLGDTLKTKVELKVGVDENPGRKTAQKKMLAVKTDKPPKIDGKLDDKCWKTAPQAIEFTHVTTEKPAKDQTVVKLVYTDKSIYVAWHLYDSQPDKIVAHQYRTKDLPRFANEDTVCFSIDPFHTHQPSHRIRFMANPLGKKYIHIAPGRTKRPEWAKRWKVAADIVSDGWVVEMEIPWQLLDYPETTEPTHMGINFDRKQQRTGEHSWWSNIGDEKLYSNDGNWLRVLPPSKPSDMQGMIDAFEAPAKGKLAIHGDLNPVDGLRLGGGVELGKRWYSDPFFFESAGETIRRNIDANSTENDFGMGSRITLNPFLYGSMSFPIHGNGPNYRLGTGVAFGDKSNLTYAVQLHRLTSVRDRDILLSASEQFLRTFFKTDFQDYYIRQGGVMALQWQHASLKHALGLSLLLEEHESIAKATDYTSVSWFSNGERRNSPIDDGRMHSLTLKYDFDTRENTSVRYHPNNRGNKNEWYNTFLVEHANSDIGSDYDFTRFVVHLRNYHPIGENWLDTRLKVGLASTSYMLPFQRQFVLGGPGTLRGYSLYEFVGNHGFLFNLEYHHSVTHELFIVPFVDIGQAWENLEDINSVYPKVNLGIGFQFGIFRLNFAGPIDMERGYQANFKWSRPF